MRTIYIIILILSLFACNQNKVKSIKDRVHSSDTLCKTEILEAENDILKNKLVYCNYVGNIVLQPLRAEKEMDSLLVTYNIEFKNESSPCVIQENRNYNCYCDLMQEEINKKFGAKFTDSLLYLADSLWVSKNLENVFDNSGFGNNWDKPALFPGDTTYDQTNHLGLQIAFDKIVKYPDDYRTKQGENSMAMLQVNLNIDENGKARVNEFQVIFWNSRTKEEDYNKRHWNYFKTIAKKLIEETTWIPSKIKNVSVKSKNDIFIYLQ